jgi:hypothetical protein
MMRKLKVLVSTWLFLWACCLYADTGVPYTSEVAIRDMLVRKVAPVFPPEALASVRHAAVIEAHVVMNVSGDVVDATILESPDPSLNKAVLQALWQWKFRPFTDVSKDFKLAGKLTFYCIVDGKSGRIVNPDEVGIVELDGREPAAPKGKAR